MHLDWDDFLWLQAFTFLYCLVTYIIFFFLNTFQCKRMQVYKKLYTNKISSVNVVHLTLGNMHTNIMLMVLYVPVEAKPSCLQTTLASLLSQKSSHTVPHALLLQISTRPLEFVDPVPRRRISPFKQVDKSGEARTSKTF